MWIVNLALRRPYTLRTPLQPGMYMDIKFN
jgi:hypothetical protein